MRMNKRILRRLSLMLTVVMLLCAVLPAPVSAAPSTGDQVKQQIINTYKKAKKYYGWNSFDGYCGALVNVQLYLLGITSNVIGVDGRDAYDAFKKLSISSGGYGIKAYPAARYTLKTALYDITKNGTQDAYNILVGFEKTPSVLGRRYGHSMVIHAIVDGIVYFVESYDVTLNGVRYKEGTPLTATIDEFVDYYARTTTQFDGVIYFGLKTYADGCTKYPSNATGTVVSQGDIWSQPCEDTVHDSSMVLSQLSVGEQLRITGLYLNTEKQYWYEIDEGEGGYVPAEMLNMTQLHYDDVTLSSPVVPTVLTQGRSFSIKGAVTASYNSIYAIRARIYRPEADQMVQIVNAVDTVQSKGYDLLRSNVSKDLTFRSLEEGQYRYELAAIVANYFVEGGKLMTGWNTISLWSSDFLVTANKSSVSAVTFDACGGTVNLNQTVIPQGGSVGELEVPQRPGYVFLGWFTETEGGQRVTADFVPEKNMTIYAHWVSHEQLRMEWLAGGNCWYLYSDGISTLICMELEGALYYFSAMEPMCQSWMVWTDAAA